MFYSLPNNNLSGRCKQFKFNIEAEGKKAKG